MLLAADYPFLEIFGTMVLFFAWVAWIWVLVVILTDLFRSDASGWAKAGWTLFVLVLPFVGVLAYLIAHGAELGERHRARQALR
jgi:cell division protein FtsX